MKYLNKEQMTKAENKRMWARRSIELLVDYIKDDAVIVIVENYYAHRMTTNGDLGNMHELLSHILRNIKRIESEGETDGNKDDNGS